MDNIEKINNELEKSIRNINYESIIGEVIETKISNNNHYITIKNNNQYIMKCISWSNPYNKLKIGNMLKIVGELKFMRKTFNIYYNIRDLVIIDEIGEEMNSYDILKKRLISEGMIGNIKKSIERYPYYIGLLTANNSAVIKDVLSIFEKDKFIGEVIMKHSTMQGENAIKSIIEGIKYLNEIERMDVIIIFRGGGSKSDLEVFNNYEIMSAIKKSRVLIIGAIGHATDTDELINYVCDISKETPSIASKYIIEKQKEYGRKIETIRDKILNVMEKYDRCIERFKNIEYKKRINSYGERILNNNIKRIREVIDNNLKKYYYSKNIFMEQLNKLNPVIYKNNNRINTIEEFNTGIKKLKIEFVDGKSVEIYYKLL